MRTLLAGLEVIRRSPLAFIPALLEALVAGALVALGAFPAGAGAAPAAAAFPFGLYFDLKQSLATGAAWSFVLAAAALGVLVRSASLAAMLWLADGARGPFVAVWARAATLAATVPVALLPAAVLQFTGHATRYAPFVALGALCGVVAAIVLARRAVALDAGAGRVPGKAPGLGGFLAYAYVVALSGAGLAVLGRGSAAAAALFLFLLGPLHALVLLGWREIARNGGTTGGAWVAYATVAACFVFVGAVVFDRSVSRPTPPEERRGRLLLLRGVDSTSRRGSLSKLHARLLGFPPRRAVVLSYRGPRLPYTTADTRRDLLEVARVVSRHIASIPGPRLLLGHSQAALILDRIVVEGLSPPDSAVVFAAPPPWPPEVSVPAAGETGPGRPAAEAARAFSWILERSGFQQFDIDAPASPPHLRAVVAPESPIPRLSVWALGDSVWLDSDWRRPGEVNVVALTDHTGVTNDAYAYDVANAFVGGREITGHEVSWQGFLVVALRYAFEPWRP